MYVRSTSSVNLHRRHTRAKYIGVVVVILAHVGILRLMMLSSSNTLDVSGLVGQASDIALGEATAIDVTLSPEITPQTAPDSVKPTSPFERFRTLTDALPDQIMPEPMETPKPTQSLSEALGEDAFKPKQMNVGSKTGQAPKTNVAEAHVQVKNQDTKSLNDLWKAIEPCWRRNATKETQSVTLVVSFSPLGNLSNSPTIDRPRGVRLDANRLRSEAQAINALSQCGPYLMAFGMEGVSIRFPGK